MTKAYENQWGMYCSGDAEYYQKRGRMWFDDYQDDLNRFGHHINKPVVHSLLVEDQQSAANSYSRARFCMGLREEDYNV